MITLARFIGLTMGIATILSASSVLANRHSHAGTHHHIEAKTSNHSGKKGHGKNGHEKPKPSKPSAPAGATAVPSGGLKVYCATRKPLLVRQFTQGAGTTVTVICR